MDIDFGVLLFFLLGILGVTLVVGGWFSIMVLLNVVVMDNYDGGVGQIAIMAAKSIHNDITKTKRFLKLAMFAKKKMLSMV